MVVFLLIFLFLCRHCLFMSFAQFSNKGGVFFLMTSTVFVCFIYQLQIFFTSFLFTYYFADLKNFASFIFLSDVMINFFKYSS